jgi:hypothetical protein
MKTFRSKKHCSHNARFWQDSTLNTTVLKSFRKMVSKEYDKTSVSNSIKLVLSDLSSLDILTLTWKT